MFFPSAMDEEGKMSVEGTQEIKQKYLANDPSTLKKANDFTDACKSVNDENVSDGTKKVATELP